MRGQRTQDDPRTARAVAEVQAMIVARFASIQMAQRQQVVHRAAMR